MKNKINSFVHLTIIMVICFLLVGTATAMFTSTGYNTYSHPFNSNCVRQSIGGAYTNDTVNWWFTQRNVSNANLFDGVECNYINSTFKNTKNISLGFVLNSLPQSGGISVIANQTERDLFIGVNGASGFRQHDMSWSAINNQPMTTVNQITQSPDFADVAVALTYSGIFYEYNITSQAIITPLSCPNLDSFVVPNITDYSNNLYGFFFANKNIYLCKSSVCVGFDYLNLSCDQFGQINTNVVDNATFNPCGGYLTKGMNQLPELRSGSETSPIICYTKNGVNPIRYYYDGFILLNQTFNPSTVQGANEPFSIKFTYDGSAYYVVSTSLIYNNTNYGGTQTIGGSTPTFSTNFVIPVDSLTSTVNNDFYWNIILSNGTTTSSFNSSVNSQTVYPMEVDNCTNYTESIFSLTGVNDEASDTLLNSSMNPLVEIDLKLTSPFNVNTYITRHYTLTGVNQTTNFSICILNNLLNYSSFKIDGTVSYIATGYTQEFWYVLNGTLNRSNNYDPFTSKNVTLRDLPLADSKTFLFTFYDENYLTHPNAIAIVYRKYIGEGVYKEVERGKFDNNGQTHLHLVEEDVIYQFAVTENGVLLYRTDDVNAVCLETPCSITINKKQVGGGATSDTDGLATGTYSITSNTTARSVTMSFSTADVGTMALEVYKYDNSQPTDILVGSNSITAKQGSVTVTVPVAYGNETYYAVIKHNSQFVNSEWLSFSENGYTYFGSLGLFLAMILILTLGLIAVSNGAWTVVFILLGFIFAMITKLINMDIYLFGWVICLGGILIYKLAMRRSA
jgi:hypothetical protein